MTRERKYTMKDFIVRWRQLKRGGERVYFYTPPWGGPTVKSPSYSEVKAAAVKDFMKVQAKAMKLGKRRP